MVKTKISKKKGRSPTDSNSDDSYRGSSDEGVQARPQSTKKGAIKRNVRGRGSANPPGRGRGTSRGQSSSALADPLPDIDISHLENILATVQRPNRHRLDPPMVNYKKGGNSIKHLRYNENPAEVSVVFVVIHAFGILIKLIGTSLLS